MSFAQVLVEAFRSLLANRLRTSLTMLGIVIGIASVVLMLAVGDAVRVFIGSENPLFSLSGSSLIVAPYMNAERKVVGALGVIGPTRLNYARVIPVVDYTARVVGRVLDGRGER